MQFAWFSSVHQGAVLPARPSHRRTRSRFTHTWRTNTMLVASPLLAMLLVGTAFTETASAAQKVLLRTATPFAVLGATAVTNVPTSSITGDVGLSPAAGTNYAGLTQAEVTGSIFSTNGTGPAGNVNNPALLTTAKNDLKTAYVAAAGQPPTSTFSAGDNQLGGKTLTTGVYAFGGAATANITAASPLVLNGQGDPNAVFVFQASSSLVTASHSVVRLVNGAQACNVFWVVSSSATLGSASTFVGNIMALTSATLDSKATVQGRVLVRNGEVSLDANTITAPTACTVATPTTTTTETTGTTTPIPVGSPHTGFGGAAHSRDGVLLGLGALALFTSTGFAALAVRRRHDGTKVEALTSSS